MTPSVPRLWPENTIVCLAGGPSLTPDDVAFCRDRARVIAIKDAVRLAPFADVLYGCDAKWWKHYGDALAFAGARFALEAQRWATTLRNTGQFGLETDPTGLRTGSNSGYQAINLAVHLGARRIVLLGYDMQAHVGQMHWFGTHPYATAPLTKDHFELFLRCFDTIVAPLRALGVQVLNASRQTALRCFERIALEEAFA